MKSDKEKNGGNQIRPDRLDASGRIVVLGLGNVLLSDEGAGVHAVNAMKERHAFPENVNLVDGGTMGLDLLPFFEDADHLLVIDAIDLKKEPGAIAVIEDGDIPSFFSSKISIHQIGLPDVLSAAGLMGITPPKMSLIGIQPYSMETGYGLSEKISGRMEELINTALEKLKEWGAVPGIENRE